MLPDGTDPELCATTTFGSLRTALDLDYDGFYWREDIETAAPPVIILPGWYADDGNARVRYEQATSADEAAREGVDGGGAICKEVCVHCSTRRITDTWAQDPSTGEQGFTAMSYWDADELSQAWVERRRCAAE